MNNGACEDFIDALLSKFAATDDLRTLQKNSNDFEKLSDEPLTVDVLKKCFAEDRRYWEWTLEELSDSLQPLDSRVRMFSNALMRKRTYYRRLLLSRLEVLRGILKQKELRKLPISEREASCVARLERLQDSEDPVLSRATDRFQQIMKAVQQEDDSLLRSIDLYPVKPTKPHQRDSVPQLEDLLEEHKRRLQELGSAPRPPHLCTKDVRLAAIINAVEAEQRQADKRKKKEPTASAAGGAKADRLRNLSTQRKPARRRQHQQAAGAPRGKHAPTRDITRFPPSFYQYIRGFFNLLRLLLLEMASPEEESLNTEQICALVNAWQSTPRAQRTNSPWINRCSDWSLVAGHALKLLSTSGRGSPLARLVSSAHTDQQIRLPPRGFVAFNEKYDTWYWLGGSGGISQPADVEIETALLARLFSIWAKADSGAGGLKDVWMETGHSFEEYSLRSSPPPPAKRSRAPARALPNGGGDRRHHSTVNAGDDSEDEYFYGEDEQEDEEVDDLQIVSSSSVARGRQKNPSKPQRVTENVPPPYFPTEWECRLSTPEQRRSFQTQEIQRFSQPWSPFVYNQHGYASVVGPVRTASVNFAGRGSGRAREHPLLRSDRPAWVSISEIVRDAVARLPNGEGTRPEIAMLVQDSAFLAPNFNPRQLSQCISSALDRLQGEGTQSPVMYDCSRRLWIYRYRHLSPEDFFKMYEDEMASRADRFNEVMYTASSAYGGGRGGRPSGADRSWGGGGRPGLSRAPVSFENRVPDYIPDIDELTVDDPFYYHHQDMEVQYGRQRQQQQQHSRPGDDSYYEGEALEESDEEDSRDMDGGFAFSRQQSRGPPPRDHVSAAAAAEGVEGIANASDRFFSEPRRMMLHYRPR